MLYLKKTTVSILILLVIAMIGSVRVNADAGEERTVYLSATEYDYPPFSVTDSGEADGFSVELLKEVAKEMGIIVTFKIDQWSVIKEELKNGELDILPLVGYTPERDEFYDFTVPYIVMRGNIFVREGDTSIRSQEDLFGKEILVLDGDNSQEWALSIGLDSELTATPTYLDAFQLLSSGQYDAVLAQGLVGEKIISDNGITNVVPVYVYDDNGVARHKLNLEGYEQKFCFAVVEGDTELLSILNEGLSIVSVNGTYDELYQKWFPFLLEEQGIPVGEIIKYIAYALVPILALFITAYFIITRRTIRIKTAEIIQEKELSEKYLHELILSGKIFESSILNAPIPIMIHAEDGSVINISHSWTKLTGYQKEDITTIYDWTEKAYGVHMEDVRRVIDALYRLTEVQHDGEFKVNTKDGRTLIWDFYSMHIGDLPDGRAVAMSVAIDITERVKMDKMLKESEQRFKILHNASFGGIALHDKGIILDCNQGLADISGYTMDELLGMDGLKLIAPDHRDAVMNKIVSGYENPYESMGIRKNGEIYPLRLHAKNLPYQGKQVRVVEFRDITEQKAYEKALIDSEIRFKTLFEKAPIGYQSLDENGCFLVVNQTWLDMLGYQKEEVIGKWFGGFLAEGYQKQFKERFELFKKLGRIHSEFEMIHKSGHHLFIEFEGMIGYKTNNDFQQTYCTLNDITERKRLELQMIKEKESLAFTLQSIGDAVIATDSKGIINEINPVACQLTGWREHEALGTPFNQVFHIRYEDSLYPIDDPVQKALESNAVVELANHTVLISKDGTEHFIEDTAAPIRNAQGHNIGVVLVFRDVTEKKKSEREIKYISEHDYLTDLYNRRYYYMKFDEYNHPNHYPLGLMMIDVNGLKLINDAFGHHVGDQALIIIGSILKETFKDQDVISRIGGDEFTVLLPNTNKQSIQSYKDLIIRQVRQRKILNIELSLSVGFDIIENQTDKIDDVEKNAENQMYAHKSLEGSSIRSKAIRAILLTLTDKYDVEKKHSYEVSRLCRKLGTALNLDEDQLKELEQAGLFHDIGKISIPDSILNKPDKLTAAEFEIIKTHTQVGYQILRAADEYSDLAIHALHHHERWDGKGYPSALKGEDIPLYSRIINIIDAYEAMTADRPYRKRLSKEYAVAEIIRCSGSQFDPKIARLFVEKILKKPWQEENLVKAT